MDGGGRSGERQQPQRTQLREHEGRCEKNGKIKVFLFQNVKVKGFLFTKWNDEKVFVKKTRVDENVL